MKKHLFGSAAFFLMIGGGSANAGDTALAPPPIAAPYASFSTPYSWSDSWNHSWNHFWSGFYGGVTAGAAFGQYNAQTSTVAGSYLDAASAAAVSAAGAQSIKPTGFTTGIEGGYNWQVGNLLLGLEADLQAVHLNGATNSGAIPYPGTPAGKSFTVTSYGNTNWLFTARPRVGFVAVNHWLFYATGGLALTQLQADASFIDTGAAEESSKLDKVKVGYVVGGGIEAPLTERLSIKAEYLYVDFGSTAAAAANPPAGQIFTHASDLSADIVRAGLNYRFGGPEASLGDVVMPLKAPVWKAPPPVKTDWEFEAGARLWLSNGSVGASQPLYNAPPTVLASRLIYSGLDAVSSETFARVDHASGFFVKGYLGAGGIGNGHMNDEDFPAGGAYSNTLLNVSSGHIGYATIDVGYNALQTPGAKLGPFVGHNYYTQAINTSGCAQLAGSSICSVPVASDVLGLTQNNHINSLRVGVASEVMLTDRLKLTADAAYVPLVNFAGLDDHLLRQLLLPEASNSGDGVMLEATLDYYITPAWSIGVGGRYWAWNINAGTTSFNFLTTPAANAVEPARFDTERYGGFVQTSYRWGDVARPAAGDMPINAPVLAVGPMDWTGLYVGGHMGGGYSDDNWSDPFASTVNAGGFTNVAGFGDTTHATGPLGGGQIGADWQIGRTVLGIQADASAADLRGENTCFSGLGGINCHHAVSALGSITGRAGYAWDRSLLYIKGGGAWTATAYDLLANTNALTLGTGSANLDSWGWTVGGGIEYALTNHWTAFVEYDHIGLPATVVAFPTVATIDTATISVRQTVDLFKLGVNYKFILASLQTIAARD